MSMPARLPRLISLLALATFSVAVGAAEPDDVPDAPVTPREQAMIDRMQRIATSMSRSSDLAIRILYSVDGLEQRPDGTFWMHEVVPLATLVDQARGSTDPLVLKLLFWRCPLKGAACDRLDLALRWTRVDTQNQVAWLALSTAQRQAGDVEGARATFVRASQASVWHDYYDEVVRRGAVLLPADLTAPERLAALQVMIAKSGIVVATEGIYTVGESCKQSGPMRDACARVVDTMARDGNLMALTMTAPFAARAGLPLATITTYQQKADAIQWGAGRISEAYKFDASSGIAVDDSPALQERLRAVQKRIDLGERGSLERYLADQHIAEADAARAFVATMNDSQITRRSEMLKTRDAREAELRAKADAG